MRRSHTCPALAFLLFRMECRKRTISEESSVETTKKPRLAWYFKLESESSCASQEDTESVYSYQKYETDIARDTSDTDTKSECTNSDFEEYEVATASEEDIFISESSGTDDAWATAGFIAAAICDSSLEAWATEVEDSDSSSVGELSFARTDFWTCIQCKSRKNNPLFRYCEHCYQVRKTLFPPRPRRHRRANSKGGTDASSVVSTSTSAASPPEAPVKLESLVSCLSGLSQDSGISSSQEINQLELDKIVVPEHLTAQKTRKRQISESSISDLEEPRPVKKRKTKAKASTSKEDVLEQEKSCSPPDVTEKAEVASEQAKASVDSGNSVGLCIICNTNPKDSAFLHGRKAHICCCYRCAVRTWGLYKRCPVCNVAVSNVIKALIV